MALVLSYRLTMEVAAALTLFVDDVHRRPRKANLPNLNIVGTGRATLTPLDKRRTDAMGDSEV